MYWLTKLGKTKAVAAMVFALAFGLMLAPAAVSAQAGDGAGDGTDTGATDADVTDFGLSEVSSGLGGALGSTDVRVTVGRVINVALSLLGVVAVVIILAGGFKWMTAGGNQEKVDEARKMIVSGVIGLAIILSAWAIAIFVLRQLSQATGSGDVTGFDVTT